MTAPDLPDRTAECEALLAAAKPGDHVWLLRDGGPCVISRTLHLPPGIAVTVGPLPPRIPFPKVIRLGQ